MVTRRQFLAATAAGAAGPLLLPGCASGSGGVSYDEAVEATWHPAGSPATGHAARMRALVRHATLAPSSHNSQCWTFAPGERGIVIRPDLARRLPAVDPDDHHLVVSLGCAAENLAQAALADGLMATVETAPDGAVSVALEPTRALATPLFRAIPERQCARTEYDGTLLSTEELRLLERAGTGAGVHVRLLTGRADVERVLAYVVRGNTAQMDDPAFVEELKAWIRFGDAEAVRTGDGLFSRASGNPSVPRWLGSRLFDSVFTADKENDKYARHIRSSAGIAVFVSDADDAAHRVEAGRCYERFALQATALGVQNAFVNQPVEVPALRAELARALGAGERRPDLVVRFGRGPAMPRSLRRPVESVLV